MYDTELMRKILKSPMAQKMIHEISPRYGEAYAFLWIMQVIGAEWDEMYQWVEEYRLQVAPQTATWGLEYWEAQYNIVPNPDWSYDRRRQNILAKKNSRGPMNPYKMENIATVAAGFPCRIEENTAKNQFTVYVSATPDIVNEQAVKDAINSVKPPRLNFRIIYEQAVSATQYVGGIIRQKKEVTLRQIN